MTALATPDAVEAAARALCHEDPPCAVDVILARRALAAAAPLIAQQTLLDAADNVPATPTRYATARWLRARAATLTPKEN